VSPYMVTNDKLQADLTAPYDLITDQQITNLEVLKRLAELVGPLGAREMVIMAQVVNDSVLQIVVQNRLKGIFNFVCVNACLARSLPC
jgi:chaperonin GroEL